MPAEYSDAPGSNPPDYTTARDLAIPSQWNGKAHGVLIGSSTGGGGNTNGVLTDWSQVSNHWMTMAHELGHQLGLKHNPLSGTFVSPVYVSLMNYDYSYRFNGTDNIQFSVGQFSGLHLNENHLTEVLPYSLAELNFLSEEPYLFELRSVAPRLTQIDFNRNGIFGESNIRADINSGYAITPRDRNIITKTAGGFSLVGLNGNLYSIFSDLAPPVNWVTYAEKGLSVTNPGRLRAQMITSGGAAVASNLVTSGVTGDPHAIEYNGKIFVTHPTAQGYRVYSFVPGPRVGTLVVKAFGVENSARGSHPVLIKTNRGLFLFVWNESSKEVWYREVAENPTRPTLLDLQTLKALRTDAASGARIVLSQSPIGGDFDTVGNRVLLVTTVDDGRWKGAMRLNRIGFASTGDWISLQTLVVKGNSGDVKATLDRPTVIFDPTISPPNGTVMIFSLWQRLTNTYEPMEMVRMIVNASGQPVWYSRIMDSEWVQSRSAPAAVAFNGDVAWGFRANEISRNNENDMYTYKRASGVGETGLTDFDDVSYISNIGLRESLK